MTKQNLKAELEAMRLPELQAKFAEVTGEETKARSKKHLIARILEALEAGAETSEPAEPKAEDQAGDEQPEEQLSKLDIPTLQKKYEEVLQRPTRSSSKNYLVWKIRQAQEGKVPIGPRARRANAVPHKVLPVRIPASAVANLDECWKRLGLKSRTEFFRRAVHAYLDGAGEADTAALFA